MSSAPSNTGPITKNGIHPITSRVVYGVGKPGVDRTPQISGPVSTPAGQHVAKPLPTLPINQSATATMTAGSPAESQVGGSSIAMLFYPTMAAQAGRQ